MCGKFTQMMSWRKVRDLSDLVGRPDTNAADEAVIGTPMRLCQVIHRDDSGDRANSAMRWGFVDLRAKSPLERPKHIHARGETIDQLPTFADAFALRRGILLTRTFNVGQELPNGRTIQHTITPRDGKPVAIAVVWEKWENRNEGTLLTFVMVTTPPNILIAAVADRMPAVLRPEHWPLWLGEMDAPLSQVKAILQTYDGNWDMAEQKSPEREKPARSSPQPTLF
jgi:putative SOS response-associated peptidase YedK